MLLLDTCLHTSLLLDTSSTLLLRSTAPLQVATVLQLVVQHADLDNLSVIRLLRVSSAIRAALQQGTGRWSLGPRHPPALASVQQVTAFGAWLPAHCGLVSELNLRLQGPHAVAGSLQPGWAAAAQVVTFALQLCSSCPAAPGHAAAALQLKAFYTDFVHSPAALQSLASCSSLVKMAVSHVPQQHLTSAPHFT